MQPSAAVRARESWSVRSNQHFSSQSQSYDNKITPTDNQYLIRTKFLCGERCAGLGSDGLADPPYDWPAEGGLAGGATIAAEFSVAAAAAVMPPPAADLQGVVYSVGYAPDCIVHYRTGS